MENITIQVEYKSYLAIWNLFVSVSFNWFEDSDPVFFFLWSLDSEGKKYLTSYTVQRRRAAFGRQQAPYET